MGAIIGATFESIITVPANSELSFPVSGQVIACLEADAEFKLKIEDSTAFFFAQGIKIKPGYDAATAIDKQFFQGFSIVNPNASPLTCHILVCFGDIVDSRLQYSGTVSVSTGSGVVLSTREAVPAVLNAAQVNVAPSTATLIKAAHANRQKITIFNPAAPGGALLYVSSASDVTASTGFPIPPQNAMEFTTTAALYAFHAGAGSINVPYSEEAYS